jgi:hypothetical protein
VQEAAAVALHAQAAQPVGAHGLGVARWGVQLGRGMGVSGTGGGTHARARVREQIGQPGQAPGPPVCSF